MNGTVKMYGLNYWCQLRGDSVEVWSDRQGFAKTVPIAQFRSWVQEFKADNPASVLREAK